MSKIHILAAGLAVTAALTAPVQARPERAAAALDAVSDPEAIEVDRDAVDLRTHIRDRSLDPDSVDTAVVFTNTRSTPALVKCVGFDDRGHIVGAARTRVPGNGLRYLRASDIAHDRDFVGSVLCKSNGRVIGSALLVGAQLTDLEVRERSAKQRTVLRFPLVATY
jgi:hypothetical protein